ncbi:ABC-three component system middle component 2 [Arcanobacterium phocae]|uniref:ABC-three component system middle component 2 n=1 Tax=Arcanobacterium phocae TaxID=131112 RepID=UPI001C0F307B|nr:ABC-three component system middle component 2 [Arcanobacterium phocae]
MNAALFNNTLETAARLLIALPIINHPANLDEIAAADLAATYMRFFGYGERNLHGDSEFALAEFQSHRIRVDAGLRKLVRAGYVISNQEASVFTAAATATEQQALIRSEFADAYRAAVTTLVTRGLLNDVVYRATQAVTQ